VAEQRKRGIKIGSTTGYTREMMDLLLAEAARRGYEPDSTVCATDVPAGRPEPWMCLQNAQELGVYPMEACVKIGDTLPDIEEGRHPLSGGLADYCHLAPGTAVFRVPPELSDAVACPANCATATNAAAMRYAGPCAGRVVLVQGAGMLGLTTAAMAASAGASEIIVCDKLAERVQLAGSFGATLTACVNDNDPLRATVDQATSGRGVDIAIDVSGAPAAIEAGIKLLRIGGRYVLVGAVFPVRPVSIFAETVVRNLLCIQGVHNYVPNDLRTALRFLQREHSRFPFEGLVAETFCLEDAKAAFARASRSGVLRVAVRS